MKKLLIPVTLLIAVTMFSCSRDDDSGDDPMDPVKGKDINTAEKVSVDRFSADAGTLMIRDGSNGLPEANEAVNFDMAPFITKGLGPSGEKVEYYNFDVQSTTPAPIYVFFRAGASEPMEGQHNIIGTLPGDADYNDFWHVHKVTVPANYVANVITSVSEITAAGYAVEATPTIVNCPVVPFGSTAGKRLGGESADLTLGWYEGKAVAYFNFSEKMLTAVSGKVPLSPIYVMFNDNSAGPSSGFMTETGTDQTHNVVATIPSSPDYSPLWSVNVVDNADFANVMDLSSAQSANILDMNVATVNCPVVVVN